MTVAKNIQRMEEDELDILLEAQWLEHLRECARELVVALEARRAECGCDQKRRRELARWRSAQSVDLMPERRVHRLAVARTADWVVHATER